MAILTGLVAGALLFSGLAATGAKAARRAIGPCHTGRIVVAGGVRIIERDYGLLACVARHGRYVTHPVAVTPSASECGFDFPAPVLRGRFVAYAAVCGKLPTTRSIRVVDVTTGHEKAGYPSSTPGFDALVVSLVVSATGTVAWSTAGGPASTPPGNAIRTGSGSTVTVLDSGPGVKPRTLHRVGTQLVWANAGITRTAPLN